MPITQPGPDAGQIWHIQHANDPCQWLLQVVPVFVIPFQTGDRNNLTTSQGNGRFEALTLDDVTNVEITADVEVLKSPQRLETIANFT